MTKKEKKIIERLVTGDMTREEVKEAYMLDEDELHALEDNQECQHYKEECVQIQKDTLLGDLSKLTKKIIHVIDQTAEAAPPKDLLDMLLKLLDRAEKLGIPLNENNKKNSAETSILEDSDLREILKNYIRDLDEK